jgi:hypothetical protein
VHGGRERLQLARRDHRRQRQLRCGHDSTCPPGRTRSRSWAPAWTTRPPAIIDIRDDLTILGAGAATTTVDGSGIDRVFHSDPAGTGTITVSIQDVTSRTVRPS